MKKHYRSESNCLNCEAIVADKFCPSCGQENLELHENFLHLVTHSVGHYFHFESKFFKSIVPLLTKPGYLTKEYFAGKRASHLNPVSMYIFISIVFFTLFTTNTHINKKETTAEEKTIAKVITSDAKGLINKQPSETSGDKAARKTKDSRQEKGATGKPEQSVSESSEAAMQKGVSLTNFDSQSRWFRSKMKAAMHDEQSRKLFQDKLYSNLPKSMFILLPLFALILKLVNRRSKKYYTEHLIYSIHVHSFLFLFGSILIALKWILPFISIWIQLTGFVVMIWYIYRSMRNIYRSTRWRTVYKFFLLACAYSLLLIISEFIILLVTLYTI